jgi:predicted CopG family antitoxin
VIRRPLGCNCACTWLRNRSPHGHESLRPRTCLSKCVDINTVVSVKTVTLTKDAYDALASLKGEGESFSEVVRRLTGSRILLSAFAGAWKGAPPSEIEGVRRFLQDSDRLSRAKIRRVSRAGGQRG